MRLTKCIWNGKTVNSGWVTTFSKRTIVSEDRITTTPKSLSFEIAGLMGIAVGLNVVQVAAIVSANPIIAVDIHDSKLGLARKLGATRSLNVKTAGLRGGIGKIEVVVENTGNAKIDELAYELTAPQGCMFDRSPVLQRQTHERGSTKVNYE